MKLSEKIIALRKATAMTQEELAALCSVSRQSVSKWEADIALPETEKLLILGDVFHVSMDVLLRDDLLLDTTKKVKHCSQDAIHERKREIYEGTLIKESISDDALINLMNVHKIELWKTGGTPRYWTVLSFTSDHPDFPNQAAKVMISDPARGGNWFVDFKAGNQKYVVFKDKVLTYHIGYPEEKEAVCAQCRQLGISDAEMNWSE